MYYFKWIQWACIRLIYWIACTQTWKRAVMYVCVSDLYFFLYDVLIEFCKCSEGVVLLSLIELQSFEENYVFYTILNWYWLKFEKKLYLRLRLYKIPVYTGKDLDRVHWIGLRLWCLARRVPLVEQKLFTLPEHLSSPRFLVGFVLLHL